MPSSNPLPPSEANLFKKILKSYEQKQYRKSLQYVKEILKKFPDHGETLAMKGLILNYCNKKAEAYECAQKGLRNDLKSHVCWHVYGLLQRADRKYDEAIKCYRNALKCDPENIQILRDLSLLQIQIRDLDGYRDTRYQLLQLRPTQRVSWIGYAMSYHLLNDYELASNILEEFCKTQQTKSIDFEQSELLLYQNMVYAEAGLYEKALKHLDENEKYIVDKLKLQEMRADCYYNLNKMDQATKLYEELLERNPDNLLYYKKLESCLNLKTVDERKQFYQKYSEIYTRSDLPRKQPLEFLSKDEFHQAIDKYMRRALRKGVPPLFKELKYLFEDDDKLKIVESLVMSYAQNLSESGRFAKEDNGDKEYPTTLLWVYYYLAQHFDYKNQSDKALYYINLAIEHTPTLVELYMVKGKINKHIGNYYEAVRWMDEAQSLDTADRFINYKCSKYMLRANMIDEAQEIASKFTRENTLPFEYLKEMQCMWFETECANAYKRLGKFGESLKKCHQVERHFQEFVEDQFDFHSYCMRKMTLMSYVEMLRLEDKIRSHPFFFKAAKTAIEVYLRLHDKPLSDNDLDANLNLENLTPSELKKLKNKQKKQQIKAQIEKDKQQQIEQKKKELSKQKQKEDGGDVEAINEEELVPEKLEKPENALEECNRFLKPIEEFASQYLDTQVLAFEVYSRKNKFMLMIRSLKQMQKLKPTVQRDAKFHYYLGKFLLNYSKSKSNLNEVIVKVVDDELSKLLEKGANQSVEEYNSQFIKSKSNNYDSVIEAAKLMYQINPETTQSKALNLLTDISNKSFKVTLKNGIDVMDLLENDFFGKVAESVLNEFKSKMRSLYPNALRFKSIDEQNAELEQCVKVLSTTLSKQTTTTTTTTTTTANTNELADKMASTSLKA